ncbi:DEAD/DEAH box helicase [Flindersiella endophytica]
MRFEPADPPRTSVLIHADEAGRTVRTPIADALPLLLATPGDLGEAAAAALQRVAAGELEPTGTGAWRITADLDEALRPLADAIADGLVDQVAAEQRLTLRVEGPDPFRIVVPAPELADSASLAVAVRRAARIWPPLERLLHQAVPDEMELDDEELAELSGHGAERLIGAGVDVDWLPGLTRDLTATAVARGSSPSGLGGKLEIDWRLDLAGSPLTQAEVAELAAAKRSIVRLRDQWVLVSPDVAHTARAPRPEPVQALDLLGDALAGTVRVGGWLEDLRASLAQAGDNTEAVEPPHALKATLRDYQLAGLRWLVRMTSLGLGCCLADDMGLGKTITLIALHLHRLDQQELHHQERAGPTLVVCPASLLGNWEREIQRFAPGTPVRRYHGTERDLATSGFVLTTYGTMRLDAERLAGHDWDLVVADEAQHVKNPLSSTAKALRRIPATARVALTGTPVENNLSELWAILDWATPGLLGSLAQFRDRWAKPIEADRDPVVTGRFARLVRPFLLRRRKSDPGIAPELPAKTETDQLVALTAEQAGLYEATVTELMADVRRGTGMARRGAIMKLLTALKQICNHPAQYLKDSRLPGRSGKLELLDELLDTILAEDGAALVFTQYVAMARLLQRHLDARGIGTQLLHGGTPVAQRERMVERFQAGDTPVFLLSLKAAGTGLNLTHADHVIHYDRWWNPAVEDQATDRAYRIGQTRPVQVHRLIAEGTLEDRIANLLAGKRALAEAVLTGGESALTELSDAELAELVELRRPQ